MSALEVLQANLHHAKGASATLCRIAQINNIALGLIQEPWVFDGQIRGLNTKSGKLVYDRSIAVPRAAILIGGDVKYLPLTNFISRDLAAVLVEVPTLGGATDIVMASAYFPGDEVTIPPSEVQQLINFCKSTGRQLILGCDANAHHTVWGSSNDNKRGEYLLDYIMTVGLSIANKGSKPTFINAIREEVLDLTLCTRGIEESIWNWRVSDEVSLSDHQHIRFEIPSISEKQDKVYRPRKTNWLRYRDLVGSENFSLARPLRTREEIELAANHLGEVLLTSFHNSTVAGNASIRGKVPWWNSQLANKRKLVRSLFNRAKRSGSWEQYRTALTDYNNSIRQSKRASWRSHCDSIDRLPEAARLHKALNKVKTNEVGLLKKPDGSFTTGREDTLEFLLQTHFPGSVSGPPTSHSYREVTAPTGQEYALSGVIFDRDK
ncbi:uncharacterized protein LOC119664997, partial [Teleopsis dalmanni]|uniref:uncharacterized protein LOC119664997 n=1 Tax=Teleopsis dalmanni TaxID=139649 RepID=UPI0018CDE7A5